MPEQIFVTTDDGRLNTLREEAFASEKEFQLLISEYPELLDGGQITPGEPRRWILITREKGIAEATGQADKWAVDHLLVDQDGIPTLAELKRGSNREIRRAIVGQLLEYAAHASVTWTSMELRRAFEEQSRAQGTNSQDRIDELLQSEGERTVSEEEFWDRVSTNLAAKRLRLLFVADEIPDPLARVVEFLNAQMPNIEVLAVEIKRFVNGNNKTLVPKVIGRTMAKTVRSRLTQESFLAGFENNQARDLARRLLEVAKKHGADLYFGTTGMSIRARSVSWPNSLSIAWLYPHDGAGWMSTRDFSFGEAVSNDPKLPKNLQMALEDWVRTMSSESFAEDASSKGVKAAAIKHDDAIKHSDLLVHRLDEVLKKLAAL